MTTTTSNPRLARLLHDKDRPGTLPQRRGPGPGPLRNFPRAPSEARNFHPRGGAAGPVGPPAARRLRDLGLIFGTGTPYGRPASQEDFFKLAVVCDTSRVYTLSGDDADALRDLCELARVVLQNHPRPSHCERNLLTSLTSDVAPPCCTYIQTLDIDKISSLVDKVFDD